MKRNSIWMAFMLLVAFTSCVKTKIHYVDNDLKVWFVDQDKADFMVRDQNDIVQVFRVYDTVTDMIPGSSYFLCFETNDDLCENIHQDGRVTYFVGDALRLSITNYYETSTHFSLYFYDVCFTIEVADGQFSCSECLDDRALVGTVPCTMEMLDSHEVNGKSYQDIMHFKITDFDAISSRNTFPSELYYAKHYGPIEYELGGEVRCLRQ